MGRACHLAPTKPTQSKTTSRSSRYVHHHHALLLLSWFNRFVFSGCFRVNLPKVTENSRSIKNKANSIAVKLNKWGTCLSQWIRTTCRTSCPSFNWSATPITRPLQIKSKRMCTCSRDWLTLRRTKVRCSNKLTAMHSESSTWNKTLVIRAHEIRPKNLKLNFVRKKQLTNH